MLAMCSGLSFGGRVMAQANVRENQAAFVLNQTESSLAKYAVNLTGTAGFNQNDFAAIIKGNESELNEITAALSRRPSVNPVIFSDNGANSALQLVQTLAAQIAAGQAPPSLLDKQIYWLDTARLYEGAENAEEINRRWETLLAEVKTTRGRAVLFVRELPSLIGANAETSGETRALLEQAILEGNLRVIGEVFDEQTFESIFASYPKLAGAFRLVRSGSSEEVARKKAKTEREREGFVGAKIAPDLEEMMNAGDDRVEVIAQVGNLESPKLQRLLQLAEAKVFNTMPGFGALEISVPARNLAMLAESRQMHYLSPNRSLGSLGTHINTTTGYNTMLSGNPTLKGKGIGIAVLDSGINSTHSSFRSQTDGTNRVRFEADFTGVGNDHDYYGHGTHVASVAAGTTMTDGDTRFNGIAQEANVIGLRVLDGNGRGQTAWVLKALDWVLSNRAAHNIRVVNMSLGGNAVDSYKNDALCRAVRKLVDHGIVVVAAAGNDGKDANGRKVYGRIHSPGNEPSAITVGASNTYGTDDRVDDTITTYSSRGPTRSFWTDSSNVKHYDNIIKPDIVAPGNKIIAAKSRDGKLTTMYPSLLAKDSADDSLDAMYLSGTSVSAPVVAGAVAVMLQANPNLTPNVIKSILQYTAQPLKNFNMFEQGAGQLNIVGAVQVAKIVRTDLRAKFVTDLPYVVDNTNPSSVEKDKSNNTDAVGDGNAITLGGVQYTKGFGVDPDSPATNVQIRVPLNGNYQYFMSDIGIDDEVGTYGSAVFQVWADGAKLYDSGVMYGATATKSVKVDVSGKNELKLIVTNAGDNSDEDHGDWAAPRLTPKVNPSDNLLTAALPAASTTITGAGAAFSWSQGIIFNRTYGTGSALITKNQKVYGEGWLLGDGVTESSSTVAVNTTRMTSSGITLGTQIKTSNGIVMGDGITLTNVSNLLGDGVLMSDGITMGDGIVMGDGVLMSDGIVMGDARAMSVLASGDNTAYMRP